LVKTQKLGLMKTALLIGRLVFGSRAYRAPETSDLRKHNKIRRMNLG